MAVQIYLHTLSLLPPSYQTGNYWGLLEMKGGTKNLGNITD